MVGPLGVNLNFAQGIDFDNATGILHAWLYVGGGVNAYSSLNLTTGAATPFAGTEPAGEFEGAIRTGLPAPGGVRSPRDPSARPLPCGRRSRSPPATRRPSSARSTRAPRASRPAPGRPSSRRRTWPRGPTPSGCAAPEACLTAQDTRAFIVVDCATLKANVAKAKKKVKKAKAKLKAAKATGDPKKIKKAQKKYKKAKAKRKAAKAALKAEPVCL